MLPRLGGEMGQPSHVGVQMLLSAEKNRRADF